MADSVDYSIVQATPGHGKPLRFRREHGASPRISVPLPNALTEESIQDGYAGMPLTTLREFTMIWFMNAITDKKNWQRKICNNAIVERWKAEGIDAAKWATRPKTENAYEEQPTGSNCEEDGYIPVRARWPIPYAFRDESPMTNAMVEYCIAELRHRADHQQSPTDPIPVYHGIVKSDTAVSFEVMSALQKAVRPLENVPAHLKDWHPGSDGKVLDLVHPSLYPLMYGVSRAIPIRGKVTTLEDCLKRIGEGNIIPSLPEEVDTGHTKPESNRFQWLPCEVDITGEKAKIVSYINNLHPQHHRELYGVIEDVITAAIPLWELSLEPLDRTLFRHFHRIRYTECLYDPYLEDWYNKGHGPQKVVLPEPGEFDPQKYVEPIPFQLKEKFASLGRPLQVIVKLANIELTPEKPDYEGGSWHIEGKLNERIVATALYYYSASNITKSSLAFRQISDVDEVRELSYEQDQHSWLTPVFGCTNEDAVQFIGSVSTLEGRLLTFPNLIQHQVQPFSLKDRTKPGHRKILALFLVDPHFRVPSTGGVPPQQLSWWRSELELEGVIGGKTVEPVFDRLPVEIQDHIYEEIEGDKDVFPITLARAKQAREELMEERKSFMVKHDKIFLSTQSFSLCEH